MHPAQADRVVFLNLLSNLVLEHDSTNEGNVKTDQQLYEATYNKTWSPGRLNVKSNFGSYEGANAKGGKIVLFCGAISEPSMKLPNWHSFIDAAGPCKFVMIY